MPKQSARASAGLSRRQRLLRTAVVVLLLGAYCGIFHEMHRFFDRAVFVVGVIPVLAAGLMLGMKEAVAATLFLAVADSFLARSIGVDRNLGAWAGALTFTAKLVLGIGVGWLRSLLLKLAGVNSALEREIQARNELAAELQRSLQLHQTLIQSMGEGVGLFDAEERFLFANEASGRLLERSASDLVGHSLVEFLDDESQKRLDERDQRSSGGPVSFDVSLTNGRRLLVTETPLAPQPPHGSSYLRVLCDITERSKLEREQRELEAQLQRTQALESLAVLAGGVAHDFNNLLSGIVGNAELSLLKLKQWSPAQLQTSLEEIKCFAREASELSRQMLAYAGRRGLSLECIQVGEEASDVLRLLQSTIASRATLEFRPGLTMPKVRGDRGQLRQVCMNLILNALDAMSGRRGKLLVETRSEELLEPKPADMLVLEPGTYVVLSVTDNGIGMDRATQARIFEPFFSTKFAGRGMGLAATMGIVKAHRGAIVVTSEPGRGSTFEVYLPAHEAPDSSRTEAASGSIVFAPHQTVLLVDDELAVRSVTSRLLQELGLRVVVAADGRRAIELVRRKSERIDLVILDLTMPALSGAETWTELRKLDPSLRAVLTSGYHPADVANWMDAPGIVGFLQKPHTVAGLKDTLDRVLEADRRTASG